MNIAAFSRKGFWGRIVLDARVLFKSFFSGFDSGFTLLELIVAIALTISLSLVAFTMIYQVLAIPQAADNHLQTVLAVESVGDWLIKDGQQATAADVDISSVPVTGGTRRLRLACQYTSERHQIDYVLLSGNQIRRDDYLNGSSTATSEIIAENITTFTVSANDGNYQVVVGSTINGISSQNTQLTYLFKPRL